MMLVSMNQSKTATTHKMVKYINKAIRYIESV